MKHNFSNKTIWKIALPIMLGNLAQTVISITDTAFLSKLGPTALGAASLAAIYYFVFSTLAWGFSLGVQVIIARRFGQHRPKRIGVIFNHSLVITTILGIFLFSILKWLSPYILNLIISSETIYVQAIEFIDVRSWGIMFVCFNYLFRSLYIGISNTKIITYTTIVMALVNIVLDYSLIFGKFGAPQLGAKGAALASVTAEISALIFFFAYTFSTLKDKGLGLFKQRRYEPVIFWMTLKIAVPAMGQKLLSYGTWMLYFSFVERMGELPLASMMTTRSLFLLVCIPLFAYAATANTLVSRIIGEGYSEEVMPLIWRISRQSFLVLLPIVLLLCFFSRQVLSIYTDDLTLINASIASLYTISLSAITYTVGLTLFEGISGTGNTDHALYVELGALVLYIISAWYFALGIRANIEWVWFSEAVYGVTLGASSYWYLKCYNWLNRKRI